MFHIKRKLGIRHFHSEAGLGLVEMIVVLAIILTTLVGLLQLITLERRTQIFAQEETAGYMLAREALEAVRSTRDEDWTNITDLTYATRYYPNLQSNAWVLSSSNPGAIGIYTQWIEVTEVFRDASDNIATSGASDTDTAHVTAFVSWTRIGGSTRTIQLETYLTNWQAY